MHPDPSILYPMSLQNLNSTKLSFSEHTSVFGIGQRAAVQLSSVPRRASSVVHLVSDTSNSCILPVSLTM